MKGKTLFVLAAIALVVATSCASAPKKATNLPETLMQAKKSCDDSRAKAVEIKAPVAAKETFAEAESAYQAAKDLETAADFEKATTGYHAAKDAYAKAYDEAATKKDAALKAMDKAASERKTSEEALSQAAQEKAAAEGAGKED